MGESSELVNRDLGPTSKSLIIARKARIFEWGMWGFLVTLLTGTFYGLWNGSAVFASLRQAQLQFSPVLNEKDISYYPTFVKNMTELWPERMAANAPDLSMALTIGLSLFLLFMAFYLQRRRPRGQDLDDLLADRPRQQALLKEIRDRSGFTGRLLRRNDDQPHAVSLGGAIYLPRKLLEGLDRRSASGVAEKIAFVVSHEMAHGKSWDNGLWALGAVTTAVTIGLLVGLLVEFIILGTAGLAPPQLARLLTPGGFVTLALVLVTLQIAIMTALVAGVVTNFIAVREYFADYFAAERVALPSWERDIPYSGVEEEAQIRTWLDPWRLDCAPPDRLLHVHGISPKSSAMLYCLAGSWFLIHTTLVIMTGLRYDWSVVLFDIASLAFLLVMVSAMPPRAVGVRNYRRLPRWAFFLVAVVIGLFMLSLDALALQLEATPFFEGALAAIFVPYAVVAGGVLTLEGLNSRRFSNVMSRIAEVRPRVSWKPFLWFILGITSWGVDYAIGWLCLLTASQSLVSISSGPDLSLARILSLWPLAVALLLAFGLVFLMVRNTRIPVISSVLAQCGVVFLFMILGFVIVLRLLEVSKGNPELFSGTTIDWSAVSAQMTGNIAEQIGLSAIVSALLLTPYVISWLARYRFNQWQRG